MDLNDVFFFSGLSGRGQAYVSVHQNSSTDRGQGWGYGEKQEITWSGGTWGFFSF